MSGTAGGTKVVQFGVADGDWEDYWFDIGFWDSWAATPGPSGFGQNSRLATVGPWLEVTVGTEWQGLLYQPYHLGDTYAGGLYDGAQECSTSLTVQSAQGVVVRLGFCSQDKSLVAYSAFGPFSDNDEQTFEWAGVPLDIAPATPFIGWWSATGDDSFQMSQWESSGPEWLVGGGGSSSPTQAPPSTNSTIAAGTHSVGVLRH